MIEGTVKVEPNLVPSQAEPAVDVAAEATTHKTPHKRVGELFITAGQQLIAAPTLAADDVRPANADRVSSWRNGQVVFENSRLAAAVAELKRYTRTPIQLPPPTLSDLRISVSLLDGRTHPFVQA